MDSAVIFRSLLKDLWRKSKKFRVALIISVFLLNTVFAATFTVNDAGDAGDANAGDGTCETAGAVCTFRAAVEEANALAGRHTILFNDAVESSIGSAVSVNSENLTINGGGNAGVTGSSGNGIEILSNGVTLQNLNVSGATNAGINVSGNNATISNNEIGIGLNGRANANGIGVRVFGSGATISGNQIMNNTNDGILVGVGVTDVSIQDNTVTGNVNHGIEIFATGVGDPTFNGGNGGVEGVEIGTTTGNTISGNGNYGVYLDLSGKAGDITLQRNKIGTDSAGTVLDGNTWYGVRGGGTSNTILIGTDGDGVNDADEGNVISGNPTAAIDVNGDDVTIAGNKIGTNVNGTGNFANGVGIRASGTTTLTIGGDASTERNIIGYNTDDGIIVVDGATVSVRNNYVGWESDGTTAATNSGEGISITGGTDVTVQDNYVGGSTANGISVTGGSVLTMIGNIIGMDTLQSAANPNATNGIHINSAGTTSVTIGGSSASQANVIAANAGDGIYIQALAENSTPVAILGNYIGMIASGGSALFGNTGAGIRALAGALTIGGENDLANGNLASGNIISANGGRGLSILDNVISAAVYGNVLGLKKGRSGSYDTVAPNTDTNIYVASNVLTSLIIGAADGAVASTKRNIISASLQRGIDINEANDSRVTIKNNYVGTDYSGAIDLGNAGVGIYSEDGTINVGGEAANEGNLISGNNGSGIDFRDGTLGASVLGNIIGLNAAKTADLGNGAAGIHLGNLVADAIANIGSVNAGGANYIGGNVGDGIDSSANLAMTLNILGNIIGLNADGDTAIANDGNGVHLSGSAVVSTIGNGVSGGKNIISGNLGSGIYSESGNGLTILGNYIGTNLAGDGAIGNGSAVLSGLLNYGGVTILETGAQSVVVGGDDLADSNKINVISGNSGHGVALIGSTGAEIKGNYIGTDALGAAAIPNVDGDTSPDTINGAGLAFYDAVGATITDPEVQNNVISGNAGSGIAILHEEADGVEGLGQVWTNGYIKGNYIGVAADGSTSLDNTDYGIRANSSTTDLITRLIIGNSTNKNIINNRNHVGVYLADVTPTDLTTTMSANNTWTDEVCAITFNWVEQYVAGRLTYSLPLSTYCTPAAPSRDAGGSGGGIFPTSRSNNTNGTASSTRTETESQRESSQLMKDLETIKNTVENRQQRTGTETESLPESSNESGSEIESSGENEEGRVRVTAPPRQGSSVGRSRVTPVQQSIRRYNIQNEFQADSRSEFSAGSVVEKVESVFRSTVYGPESVNQTKEERQKIRETDRVIVEKAIKQAIQRTENRNELSNLRYFTANGEERTITEDTRVIFTNSIDEAKQLREVAANDDVVVFGPDSDLNKNSVADLIEIATGVPLDQNDPDGDGITLADEFYFGTDPLVAEKLPVAPFVANMNKTRLGQGGYSWRLFGPKNSEVEVILIDQSTKEEISLGKTIIDEGNKGEFTFDTKNLKPGKYFVILKNADGQVGEAREIEIGSETEEDAPEISLSGGYVWISAKNNPIKLAAATNESGMENSKMILKGVTQPGEVVYLTWKSVIVSSTVIADASGKFELEVPVNGEHEALVYAGKKNQNSVTRLSKLLFFN